MAAFTFTVTLPLCPGWMSARRKVEASLRRNRASEVVTEATGDMRGVAPAFRKVTVISASSPEARGFSRGERVTMTTGWGTLSRGWAGMAIFSVTLPWTRETLLW